MKKLTYIILHLLILPLLLYGFSFSVSAEETSSEDTVIQVTAEDGSDISQKLNEALINARDLASSGQIVTVRVQKVVIFFPLRCIFTAIQRWMSRMFTLHLPVPIGSIC